MKHILAALLLCSCTQSAYVKSVHDGDTFYTDVGTIRVSGIDCPELLQPYGDKARLFTDSLIFHKHITLVKIDTDKYDRKVCEVYVDGKSLAYLLAINGLAWTYKKLSTNELMQAENNARSRHIGLWSKQAIPPFKFRKQFPSP